MVNAQTAKTTVLGMYVAIEIKINIPFSPDSLNKQFPNATRTAPIISATNSCVGSPNLKLKTIANELTNNIINHIRAFVFALNKGVRKNLTTFNNNKIAINIFILLSPFLQTLYFVKQITNMYHWYKRKKVGSPLNQGDCLPRHREHQQ